MKPFFRLSLAFLALLALSCRQESYLVKPGVKTVDLVFDSYIVPQPAVKTELSAEDSTKILWSPGDSISLFWTDFSSSCFTSTNDEPSSYAKFKGSIEVISGAYEEDGESVPQFFAIYPYRKDNSCDGSSLTFSVDTLQTAVPASLPLKGYPAIARSENMNLCFYNVCGGLIFTLKNSGIDCIRFSSNEVEGQRPPVAGRIKASFDAMGKPVVDDILKPASTITLRPADGASFEPGVKYYMSILPSALKNGFTVTFSTPYAKDSVVIDGDIEVKRGVFGRVPDIDAGIDLTIRVSSIALEYGTYNMGVNSSLKLGYEILPEYAYEKRVSWSSSDESVASVDEYGVVTTGDKEGECMIYIQSLDKYGLRDSCRIVCEKIRNLSVFHGKSAWANCYIIDAPGQYFIDPVRGISGGSIGEVSSVSVLWEYRKSQQRTRSGDLIESVVLKDGKILISIPELISGNALIAAKNADGRVLWSWHLWLCPGFDPFVSGQVYPNGVQFMDRNLGSHYDNGLKSQSLLYQWGRKDPFLGTSFPYELSSSESWSCLKLTDDNIQKMNIAYTIEYPMCFIQGYAAWDNDWLYKLSADKQGRWNSDVKTDYDPCPVGWKVPSESDLEFWNQLEGVSCPWRSNSPSGFYVDELLGLDKPEYYLYTGSLSATAPRNYNFSGEEFTICLWSSTATLSSVQLKASAVIIYRNDKIGTFSAIATGEKGSYAYGVRCVRDRNFSL